MVETLICPKFLHTRPPLILSNSGLSLTCLMLCFLPLATSENSICYELLFKGYICEKLASYNLYLHSKGARCLLQLSSKEPKQMLNLCIFINPTEVSGVGICPAPSGKHLFFKALQVQGCPNSSPIFLYQLSIG